MEKNKFGFEAATTTLRPFVFPNVSVLSSQCSKCPRPRLLQGVLLGLERGREGSAFLPRKSLENVPKITAVPKVSLPDAGGGSGAALSGSS